MHCHFVAGEYGSGMAVVCKIPGIVSNETNDHPQAFYGYRLIVSR